MSQSKFSTLALKPELLTNIESLGYEFMTPIQEQSLPDIIMGKDVIGQGKTGSGKTAAFGLGLLQKLDVKRFRIQSLVLCPTRELADQVAKELRRLARSIHNIKILTLCGGTPFGPQIGSLEHGAHIIVGTPGRVEEHVIKGTLNLENLNLLILDEADRMLDMGFQPALDNIVRNSPKHRQTLLFSATFPNKIKQISERIMTLPTMVKVESTHDDSSISQHFYHVQDNEERLQALQLLLLEHKPESCVVFCNTKKDAQLVADELVNFGFSTLSLHGDLEQRDRDETLVRFSNKSTNVLVATDVAARGLDIDNLDMVVNFHIALDTEVHVHRIGRTGRAGSKGMACSLYSDKESYKVALLEDYLDQKIIGEQLPNIRALNALPLRPDMITIQISGGKRDKVRPGDILGALTGDKGIKGDQVGKINVAQNFAYVAIKRNAHKVALKKLEDGKIKGRNFRIRVIR
ncbi:ATP-dependent RNA helicase DbpA [Thalassotalea psychrophila]|uniref:ATP-dependent RNA helicase DbpA n=1 Tax=Thalassotalea psychrophila TaxID=3065647 RepID=A0ABY9TR23_9GAMM|nr:ATP-dependent RNA helicase DbpA [Colwelliaceae bacterium SQ149]